MREHVEEPRYVTTDDDTVYSLLSKRAARTPDDIIAEWQDDNTHQWRIQQFGLTGELAGIGVF